MGDWHLSAVYAGQCFVISIRAPRIAATDIWLLMLTKRFLAISGFCALICAVAFVKYHAGLRAVANTEQTTVISSTAESPLSPGVPDRPMHRSEQLSHADGHAPEQRSDDARTAAAGNPVYLESIGVIERLQKSRHDFFSPAINGVLPRPTFRFTVDRQPLAELAGRQATVAWPIDDGGVEFVKLHTLREQDGNLFISGDVVDGPGQFVMVMTKDNSMSGHLLSSRGMYSYDSQLDEVVGQRVEGPIHID